MNKIDLLKCDKGCSIEDVLRCIDNNGKKAAFLVDDKGVMEGLLTEGDVRRLLLNGHGLREKAYKYAKKNFVYANIAEPPETVKTVV